MVLRVGTFRRATSIPGLFLSPRASARGCRSGKTEDGMARQGSRRPRCRFGEGGSRGWTPPLCDPLHLSPLLQPEEEMETVFDMEPSSTSSTPTSLVSHCLHPGGQVRRGAPAGGGLLQQQCGGHRHSVSTPGIGEEARAPGLPPLTQQDLAQVKLLPWPWLKRWDERRAKTYSKKNSKRKRKVRAGPATASSVV